MYIFLDDNIFVPSMTGFDVRKGYIIHPIKLLADDRTDEEAILR